VIACDVPSILQLAVSAVVLLLCDDTTTEDRDEKEKAKAEQGIVHVATIPRITKKAEQVLDTILIKYNQMDKQLCLCVL